MVAMYVERTVVCPDPSCATERATRAAPGIRVSCPGCGGCYKVPRASESTGTESPDVSGTVATAPAPSAPSPGPASSAGPARVSIDVGADEAPDVFAPPLDPVPSHPQTEAGKVHGAKGGRSRRTVGSAAIGRFRS